MRLPSCCERLENIDNYWQNPKAQATLHLEYCISHFIHLFAPFFLLMRTLYWLEYLIATAELGSCAALVRYGCCFLWEVILLLLVCTHFPMTQTKIKIIISVATCMALQWGRCRLRPNLCKTLRVQLLCLQANLVITVINTWHKGEDRDWTEYCRIKGPWNSCWDIKVHPQSEFMQERQGKWMSLIE